eukprot:TRINITY_DN638_c0_g1_i1.p1 TRINITY_DN638_c0_g1~~TRINITY_DN638_c0_g1_i1.p1  ORF type:complete len:102 (+),score=13.48 TRINITY_DN638_c0_g1_i1:250-555(+)
MWWQKKKKEQVNISQSSQFDNVYNTGKISNIQVGKNRIRIIQFIMGSRFQRTTLVLKPKIGTIINAQFLTLLHIPGSIEANDGMGRVHTIVYVGQLMVVEK